MKEKFNKEVYEDIWKRYQSNESLVSIANSYNVSAETIRQKIQRYKRYLRRNQRLDINDEQSNL